MDLIDEEAEDATVLTGGFGGKGGGQVTTPAG